MDTPQPDQQLTLRAAARHAATTDQPLALDLGGGSPAALPAEALDVLELADLIDAPALQAMMNHFYAATNIGIGIIDRHGRVLVATGWQDVCTYFHRVHPETCRFCIESDVLLSQGVEPGAFKMYKCRNNMWDMSTPIVVAGRHLGNLFLGQFFFADEAVDLEAFRAQAGRYDFDEDAYLAALARVPRWDRRMVDEIMHFYAQFAALIASLSYNRIQLTHSLVARDRVEAALAESEVRFRSLYQNAPIGLFHSMPEGRFLRVNPALATMLHYPSPEDMVASVTNIGTEVFVDSGLRPAILGVIMHQDEWFHDELQLRCKDGAIIDAELSGRRVLNADGSLAYLEGFVQDVTARKQSVQALRESEERLELVMEGSQLGFWDWNIETGAVHRNERWAQMLGYTLEEIASSVRQWTDLHHPDDRERAWRSIQDHLEGRTPAHRAEYRMLAKDGSYRWILDQARVVKRDAQGKPLRMSGTHTDITERKRAEEALKASEERFRNLFENAPIGIFHSVHGGRFLTANPALARMLAYDSPEELVALTADMTTQIYADPAMRPRVIQALMETDGWVHFDDVLWRRKDGGLITVDMTGRKVLNAAGEVVYLEGFIEDITERKRAEIALAAAKEAAEAANRAKSQFLANMSHELRTPLNAILGFSELLARDPNLTADQRANLAIINRSGEHLLGLINDVLDMAKIEAGRVTLQEHDFDLYRLLDDLRESFQLRAQAKQLHLLISHVPATPRFVCADESKLRQVLINLLGNALKFTAAGSVTLSVQVAGVTAAGHHLVFVVQDTGPGIQPDVMAAIFEPFVQGKGSAQAEGGTGLGLPISRQFARLMGGDLTVASAGVPGQGSCFTLATPVRIAAAPGQPSAPPGAQPRAIGLAPGQPVYRLLVVDDRAESRKLLADLLAQLGFAVRTAENGAAAFQVWEEWAPHLIWMDMRMPVMDGHETTRRIKATPQGQSTVIVALTASVFVEQRASVLADGCDDFVGKPCRQEEIVDCLVRHLGVRMVYADTPPAAAAAPVEEQLLTFDPTGLPAEWREQVQQAAAAADAARLLELAAAIEAVQPAWAAALQAWTEEFDYVAILAAIRA